MRRRLTNAGIILKRCGLGAAGITAVCAFLVLVVAAPAAAADVAVTFELDTTGAHAVLDAATSDPDHAAAAADAALARPQVQAMIAKMAKYDPSVTPAAFKAAVMSVSRGGGGEPFDLERLRKDPDGTRRMLAKLETNWPTLSRQLAERLSAFAPHGLSMDGTLVIVVGSNQNGWVPDQLKPVFYVDLGFHGEEVDSVINTASHELFHTVQGLSRPNWNRDFTDLPDLPPNERELHRAHAVIYNLVLEGMATYVGDATRYASAGPNLKRDQRAIRDNLARKDETFALFESLLLRARQDETARLDPLLSVGFGGRWDQTGYYVGYVMAAAIDRYAGRERLRALVKEPPEQFVLEYVRVASAHREDPAIVQLSPYTVRTVRELAALEDKIP